MKTSLGLWQAAAVWLLPFTSGRVFENVFVTGYRGVNWAVFIVALGVAMLTGWITASTSCKMRAVVSLVAEGLILPLIGARYGTGNESPLWLYAICSLSGVSLGTAFVTAIHSALVPSKTFTSSLTFSALPVALLTNLFLSDIIFRSHDTYFTHTDGALTKIIWLYCAQIVLNTTITSFRMHYLPTDTFSLVNPFKFSQWTRGFAPGILLALFFVQMVEWDHIVNQYPFIWQQAKIFQTYGSIGAAWSFATFPQVGWKHKFWVYFVVYILAQASMLLGLTFYVSTVLTSVCSFAAAYSLAGLIMCGYERLQVQDSSQEQKATAGVMLLSLMAFFTMTLVSLFEAFYYTNRDVKYWALINSSAVPGVGVLASTLLIKLL